MGQLQTLAIIKLVVLQEDWLWNCDDNGPACLPQLDGILCA